jgi:hypothetical protein
LSYDGLSLLVNGVKALFFWPTLQSFFEFIGKDIQPLESSKPIMFVSVQALLTGETDEGRLVAER